ncbi:MAG: hypothetical protein Ct9H300mP17_15710 [Candidatus Nitrosopelagicus sp.]|nr:MAG: hypothetical protein Ct9H300mP17_15710 [Candidatus Nitrosopelagicus sp.]
MLPNFILIARNFLKKSSLSYFKEKSKDKIPAKVGKKYTSCKLQVQKKK